MSDYRASLSVEVMVRAGTDLEALSERLFDFLASDPDDLFPEITVVDDYAAAPVTEEAS